MTLWGACLTARTSMRCQNRYAVVALCAVVGVVYVVEMILPPLFLVAVAGGVILVIMLVRRVKRKRRART